MESRYRNGTFYLGKFLLLFFAYQTQPRRGIRQDILARFGILNLRNRHSPFQDGVQYYRDTSALLRSMTWSRELKR